MVQERNNLVQYEPRMKVIATAQRCVNLHHLSRYCHLQRKVNAQGQRLLCHCATSGLLKGHKLPKAWCAGFSQDRAHFPQNPGEDTGRSADPNRPNRVFDNMCRHAGFRLGERAGGR